MVSARELTTKVNTAALKGVYLVFLERFHETVIQFKTVSDVCTCHAMQLDAETEPRTIAICVRIVERDAGETARVERVETLAAHICVCIVSCRMRRAASCDQRSRFSGP